MLQILKREDKSPYLAEIAELGLSGNEIAVSEAVDGDLVLGYALYKISPEAIEIYKISPQNDLLLFDGIARSILFLAVLKGVERAEFKLSDLTEAKKLGFADENGVLEDISSVFSGCKGCKHNNEV